MFKRIVLTGMLALIAPLLVSIPLAQADTGSTGNCPAGSIRYHNNDWGFFWAHNVRAYSGACNKYKCFTNGCFSWLPWTRTPTVTFPQRFPLSGETVQLTQAPFLSDATRNSRGDITRAVYSFSVRKCAGICNTFDFSLTYTIFATRLCVSPGGACDVWKQLGP